MDRNIILRTSASLAFVGTLCVNALANVLPINNLNTGQVSDLYPSLFTPAGITFSIWSVIYLMLLGFLTFTWTGREPQTTTKILPWFILSCVLNVAWILVWHYLYTGVSVVIMVGLLLTLTKIFMIIQDQSIRSRFFIVIPFTIYFAWICVATIANISAYLVSKDWDGFLLEPWVWTIVMMVAASLLAILVLFRYWRYEYVAVVAWALFGIYLRWRTSDYHSIVYAAVVLILILSAAVIVRATVRRKGQG